ncbi:MAG: hypothetical protein KJO98_14320, partial [Rhodothermia bacterium]|nr:hypothetical protein [Rhodothermia bacterium]
MKTLPILTMLIAAFVFMESNAVVAQDLAMNETSEPAAKEAVLGAAPHMARPHDYYRPAPPALRPHFGYAYAPNQILTSGTVDLNNSTITLPLYRGQMKDGRPVWYVITDVSDSGIAEELGINYSPKLKNVKGRAVRSAILGTDGTLTFERGTVDFSPERKVVPGPAPQFFPPAEAIAGS